MISSSDASLADIYSHCIGIDGKPVKVTYRMSKSNNADEPLLEGYVAPWMKIRNKKKVGVFKMKKNTY